MSKSRLGTFGEIATSLDTFGERFAFRLPGNKTHNGTSLGCFFTILLVLTLLLQSVLKGHTLVNFNETTIYQQVEDGFFNSSHIFSSSDGFKVAFAITAYDTNQTITEDPTYGKVIAKYRSWGDEITSIQKGELETHSCSESELGLTEQKDE